MKHLELIEYEIDTDEEPITGEYLLEKDGINDHSSLVSALGVSEKEKADPDDAEIISYLMFSRKLDKYPLRTVDIAFPVKEERGVYQCIKAPNPYVSVYFPTETESNWISSCRARSVLLRTAAAFRRMMPIIFIWQKKRQYCFGKAFSK